jgi:hypothetical protein
VRLKVVCKADRDGYIMAGGDIKVFDVDTGTELRNLTRISFDLGLDDPGRLRIETFDFDIELESNAQLVEPVPDRRPDHPGVRETTAFDSTVRNFVPEAIDPCVPSP